jgi:hypothetical protein
MMRSTLSLKVFANDRPEARRPDHGPSCRHRDLGNAPQADRGGKIGGFAARSYSPHVLFLKRFWFWDIFLAENSGGT